MSFDPVIGTCSVCGGAVIVPSTAYSVRPVIPRCSSCGATKRQPFGPVIEVEPSTQQETPGGHVVGDLEEAIRISRMRHFR